MTTSRTSAESAPIHIFTRRPARPLDLSVGNKENIPEPPHQPTSTRRRSRFLTSRGGLVKTFRVSTTIRAQKVRSSIDLHRSGSGFVERVMYGLEQIMIAELTGRFGESPLADPPTLEPSTASLDSVE